MIEIIGYIGMALILYSFTIENIYKLRLVNSIGSIFWIVYGIGIWAGPTILVNACVLCIHLHWFYKNRKTKSKASTSEKRDKNNSANIGIENDSTNIEAFLYNRYNR